MSRKASHTFVFVRGRPFDGERAAGAAAEEEEERASVQCTMRNKNKLKLKKWGKRKMVPCWYTEKTTCPT